MAAERARTVLLTGASAGIGLETARLLTSHGFEVWGTSRDITRLPKLPRFHPVEMDLQRPGDGFPRSVSFDVLINNAGAGWFDPAEFVSTEVVREQFQILLHGPWELIRLVLPHMRQCQRGMIVNVSSLAGLFPIPYMAAYSAAKAALSALSAGLRLELAHTPIRVVDVRPGDINTQFYDSVQRNEAGLSQEERARMSRVWETEVRTMQAAPRPELVARAIVRLLNNRNPPPVVTVGGTFQAKLAPFAARLAPPRLREWALRRYYRL
jgi:short-subunit dehydrogenase